MRKNWKRILAAVLAACIILGDSSLVYATESKPAVEVTDETTEEVVEEEITESEEIVEEETIVSEDEVVEVTMEEVTTEEPQIDDVEENVVVEIPEVFVTEEAKVVESAADNILTPEEEVTVTGSSERYVKEFDFTATDSGKYCLYVRGKSTLSLQMDVYSTYTDTNKIIDSNTPIERCYDLDVDAKEVADMVQGYFLEKDRTYRVRIQGNVAVGDEATFYIKKVENEATKLAAGEAAKVVGPTELKIFQISEADFQPGTVCWTSEEKKLEFLVYASEGTMWQHGLPASSRTTGTVALTIPAGKTYYIAVKNNSEQKDATILWQHETAEKIQIGETKEVKTVADGDFAWKFYEFDVDKEKDYLISAHPSPNNGNNYTKNYNYCDVVLLMNDGSVRGYTNSYYDYDSQTSKPYGEDYTDENGVYWIKLNSTKDYQKVFILGYQSSSNYTTEVKLSELAKPEEPVVTPTLELNEEVSITETGEYDCWYEFTPKYDSYYYLKSEVFRVQEVDVFNTETYGYEDVSLEYFYIFQAPNSSVNDVARCYKMEEGVTYGVRIKGDISNNSAKFTWMSESDSWKPQTVKLGTSNKQLYSNFEIHHINESETVLGKFTLNDFGTNMGQLAFYGDNFEGFSGKDSKEQVIAAIGGSSIYAVVGKYTSFNYSWVEVETTQLSPGADIQNTPSSTTVNYYEFVPNADTEYELLAKGAETKIIQIGTDGKYKSYGDKVTGSDGNTWLKLPKMSDVEKIYVIVKSDANNPEIVGLKEKVTNSKLEAGVNHGITVNGGEEGIVYEKAFDFTPPTAGNWYLFVNGLSQLSIDSIEAYNSNGGIDSSITPQECYTWDCDSTSINDVVKGYLLSDSKTYKINIKGNVDAGESATFYMYSNDYTARDLISGETSISVSSGNKEIFKISENNSQLGVLKFVGGSAENIKIYSSSDPLCETYLIGDRTEFLWYVEAGKEYYIAVQNTSDSQARISWARRNVETLAIDDRETFTNSSSESVFNLYEFSPSAEKDYLISAYPSGINLHTDATYCAQTYALTKDGKILKYKTSYVGADGSEKFYGNDYFNASSGTYARQYAFVENIEKVYVLAWAAAGTTTEVKVNELKHATNLVLDEEVVITHDSSFITYIEYKDWYEFTPKEDGYYYLSSDLFEAKSIGTYNLENAIFDELDVDYFYTLKENAVETQDVIKCYKLEAGKTYGVYVYGMVPKPSASFIWKKVSDINAAKPERLTLGSQKELSANKVYIFRIEEEKTTAGYFQFDSNGYSMTRVYGADHGDARKSTLSGHAQYHIAIGGTATYLVVKTGEYGSKLSYYKAAEVELYSGYENNYTTQTATDYCYTFTPNKDTDYLIRSEFEHEGMSMEYTTVFMVGKDGTMVTKTPTEVDVDGVKWSKYSGLSDVEKVYILTSVNEGKDVKFAFKEENKNHYVIEKFNDGITINPGATMTITYKGSHLGDYFINASGGNVKFEHISAGPGISATPVTYASHGNSLVTYVLDTDVASTDTVTFTFKITNEDSDYSSYVEISTSEAYAWIEPQYNNDGKLRWRADLESDQKAYYASYYEFSVDRTGSYEHPEFVWVLRADEGNTSEETQWVVENKEVNGAYRLEAGERYLVKFLSYKSMNDSATEWDSIEPLKMAKNWIASMEVFADTTLLGINEHALITVNPIYQSEDGTLEKADYTFKSSNPSIATVDVNGFVYAKKEGKVDITVTANAGKEGKEFVETISITVSPKYSIIYQNIDAEGLNPGGSLTDSNPKKFYKADGASLMGAPKVNEGYEFLGWYSDAKMKKPITNIAIGTKSNVNVWAKIVLKEYNIDYKLNDGKFTADVNQPMTFTIDKDTELVNPIRLGYKFDGWYDNELCQGEAMTVIPSGTNKDIELFAKWTFDANFSLELNCEKEAIVEDGEIVDYKYIITHPYNSATGEWEPLNTSFMIQSDTDGIVPVLYNDDIVPPVFVTLLKEDDNGNLKIISEWDSGQNRKYEQEDYFVTDLWAKDIASSGNYRLDITYSHPGQPAVTLSKDFIVNYAKREYPVNKEVSWSKLSNVDTGFTYLDITDEVVAKMQPVDTVFDKELGESALAPAKVTFKNSKNKVVKDTAKIVSGTYTVVLEFEENERFLTEATGTVHISYGTISNAGVNYQAMIPAEVTEGRTVGSTIAFNVPETEGAEPSMNVTPYTTGVIITPMLKLPWMEEPVSADKLEKALSDYGYTGYKVEVEVKETIKKPILSINDVDGNPLAYSITGNVAGKTNLTVDTIITKPEIGEDGTPSEKEIAKISTVVKNFTVVNGGADAIKSISLVLHNSVEFTENSVVKAKDTDTMTGAKTYLLEKSADARTYWIDVTAKNYEGKKLENAKLSWKSSNSKIAATKVAKDGTVTLTIPKNAQGVVDITVTANDVTKNSQSIQFVIVDTSMRLDTTSVTINSKMTEHDAVLDLYPNVLSSILENQDLKTLFDTKVDGEDRIAVYQKVGKAYQKSEIFDCAYDYKSGKLIVSIAEGKLPAKAATYNLYVGVLHEGDVETDSERGNKTINPSELHAFKIKDTCALPKAPSLKVTKTYEAVYKNGWAEMTLTLKAPVALDVNGTPMIQTKDKTLFEVVEWNEAGKKDGTTWNLKVRAMSDSVLPAANQKSKVTKNVEFVIGYEGYRTDDDAKAIVKTNITVTNTAPKLYVYGDDAYAPTYYTDANLRFVDVVIPVTKEIMDGFLDGSRRRDLVINQDSTGAGVVSDGKKLSVTLADPAKFEVISAEAYGDYKNIPAKKGEMYVDYVIHLTVMVRENQNKNVSLQFHVESSGLNEGVTIKTQALVVKPAKVSAEAINLTDTVSSKVVKSVVFNSNYVGKESVTVKVEMPSKLAALSESNDYDYDIIVEAADKNAQKMLQNDELLLDMDYSNDTFKVTPTETSFKYKSAKLKITTQVSGTQTVNTKSTTLAMSFKKISAPKITISKAKMIRGLVAEIKNSKIVNYSNEECITKVSYANLPVGAKVINVRFADQADYAKYYAPELVETNAKIKLIAKPQTELALGKDAIDMIFDVCTVGGEIIPVRATLNLTIADSFGLKVNVKSINLYNSAVGKAYGKAVTFSDTKGHAVKVTEIVNKAELEKAGIDVEFLDNVNEQNLKFYVKENLKRGIEKTYTVKAKVAVVNSAVQNDKGEWVITPAAEKQLTFKIVLKK